MVFNKELLSKKTNKKLEQQQNNRIQTKKTEQQNKLGSDNPRT